jgi:putative tryptophan/tyrosine transport system substrate-binding protein
LSDLSHLPIRLIGLVLALGLALAPLAGAAQSRGIPRIGYLGNGDPPRVTSELPFSLGLRELGWIEGQTVTSEYRWAKGNPDRLPALAVELVHANVDVIVAAGPQGISAARESTSTIPIVFVYLADPVAAGFVPSLARPGGNITGIASEFEKLITKQLQLLKEAVPRLSRIAILRHRDGSRAVLDAAETAARSLALKSRTLTVTEVGEFESAFSTARDDRVGAVAVLPGPYFDTHRRRLIDLAVKHRLPAIYEFKNYVEDGGLMSYGPSIDDMFRRSASYVDRILKGTRPLDLPVEQASTFELVINLKTAKALGLTIPQSVLGRADQVIE